MHPKSVLIFTIILANTLLTARSLAGVEIAERIDWPGDRQSLLLNGTGIRSKLFFDIYVAALYLPEPVSDPARILGPQLPKRLVMHIVYLDVSKKKMDGGRQTGFEDNLTKEQMRAMQAHLDEFKSMFRDMNEGDVVMLDNLPAEGIRTNINQ